MFEFLIDLQSLRVRGNRYKKRVNAIHLPVSFQAGKGKTAIVTGAML